MGFLERRADQFRLNADGQARPSDRYGNKPSARSGGSNEKLHGPASRQAAPDSGTRADLTELLGRTVLEARTQQICREYGLIPRSGATAGSGLSRSYLARDAGVEIAADTHGVVTTVFLHFHGDDGFTSYQGEIPGGAGSVARRAHLWAMLGSPDEQGGPYRTASWATTAPGTGGCWPASCCTRSSPSTPRASTGSP